MHTVAAMLAVVDIFEMISRVRLVSILEATVGIESVCLTMGRQQLARGNSWAYLTFDAATARLLACEDIDLTL